MLGSFNGVSKMSKLYTQNNGHQDLRKRTNENFYFNRFIAGILQVIPNSGHPAHLQPSTVKMVRMEDLKLCSLSHNKNGSLIMI